jgi:hypothetical protein
MEGKIFKIRFGKVFKLIPVCSKYEELISSISNSFHKTPEEMKDYCLYYIDSDNDTVILENESDYNLLLASIKNQSSTKIKIVFEKKKEKEDEKEDEIKTKENKKTTTTKNNTNTNNTNTNKNIHKNIQCNECGKYPIKGIRYKCSICPDYDICENCEKKTDHEHSFLKLKKPESLNKLISLLSLMPFGYYYSNFNDNDTDNKNKNNNNENYDDENEYYNQMYRTMQPQRKTNNNTKNDDDNNEDDEYYNYYKNFNKDNDNTNKINRNINNSEYHIPYYSNYDDYYNYYYNQQNKNKPTTSNNEDNNKTKSKETKNTNDNDNIDTSTNNNNPNKGFFYFPNYETPPNNKNDDYYYFPFPYQKKPQFEPTPNEEKPSKQTDTKPKEEKTSSQSYYDNYYFGYHPYSGYYDENNYYYNNNNYDDQYYSQKEEHSNFNFSKKEFSYKINEGNSLEFEIDENEEKKIIKLSLNNNGTKPWKKNFVFANLKNYSAVKGENIIINEPVEPNKNYDVNIELKVKELPKGEFVTTWVLQNENNENLGEPIPISIKKK